MALQARRFHGKPLCQPNYNFRDVPWCTRDLTGSTVSTVTERQHLVDSIAELTLLCNEATRRKKPDPSTAVPSSKKTTKPLSIEYIFDRIDTDDPIWGLMVRTDTPMSVKGRVTNLKASPHWRRGMLQGFITMTTFTNWQSSFRFDSQTEMAFGQDDDELEEQMKQGLRKYDEDGSLAEELEASVKGGNPHLEGIVHPRIAEVSLFGGLGCGKQLLRLLVEHLECMKATARQNYDYIVLQATENSIPFYESMGFTRVGCVQGTAESPNQYHSNPVEEYHTKKNGETPATIAKEFGVDVWDLVFLNRPLYPELVQKSWLKLGTTVFVPKQTASVAATSTDAPLLQKWYTAEENETPRMIAKKFDINFGDLLEANRKRYPDLVGHSKLMEGTKIQISRFDIDEGDTVAYSHWTFPDSDHDDHDPSYMMALKLNRKKGLDAKVKPVADSLAVPIQPYSPEASGAKDLLLEPKPAQAPLAPIFTKKKPLREPKKPKRPTTSFGHFTSEIRSSMAKELKGMSFGEINKIISEKWKTLSDDDKVPYQEQYEESKAVYNEAMEQYKADMTEFRRETQRNSTSSEEDDTSLLEKVVKLKSSDGIAGASKYEYFYVLTFIPDLQWVHLIPMRKAGVFGPEHSDASGRPSWMILGEDEGTTFDTSASLCQPVIALSMINSADADNEQWDIYDNGEKAPARRPAPFFTPTDPNSPVKPKKPATSFAYFCGDAQKNLMAKELANKKVSERTKIIAERWRVMTDEEKQQYKDRSSKAYEKYSKALKRYKKELAKYNRQNSSGARTSSTISTKTPKSAKKAKSPAVSIASEPKRGRGRLRKDSSSQSEAKAQTAAPKRDRPKKRPLPNPEANGETQTPRKRGRSTMNSNTSAASSTKKASLHLVRRDPVVLENLLGKMKHERDSQQTSVQPDENDIILSLNSPFYKEIMYRHFNILGKTRDRQRENEVCDDVVILLKQKMGEEGKFLKCSNDGRNFVVDDAAAREKIRSDLVRRVSTFNRWYTGVEGEKKVVEDFTLSMLNDEYKEIMWAQYRKLGKYKGAGDGDEDTSREIFQSLKMKLGEGVKFFIKSAWSNELFEVGEDEAVQTILRHLKRRNDSSHKWLKKAGDKPPGTPPRNRASFAAAGSKPGSVSPSRYPRRGSQPEIYPPDILDKVKVPKESTVKPQRTSSAAIESKASSSPSPRYPRRGQPELIPPPAIMEMKAQKPNVPLAPIFLKKYSKKKQVASVQQAAGSEEPIIAPTKRYPERKRKQIIGDDTHLVSDDAVSDPELFDLPRAKT